MKRKWQIIIWSFAFAWIMGAVAIPGAAYAIRSCVGDLPGDYDECHPEGGGEPASWCGQEHIQGPQSGCWCGQLQVAPPDDEGGWIASFWHRIFGPGGDPDYVATD